MIQLSKKLKNESGQSYSYISEQLSKLKIDIAADGTVTVTIINDEEKENNYLLVASLSSGLIVNTD